MWTKLCEYDDINDIGFYDDKEKAIEEIRKHCEGYTPKSQEMDENGFYVTTNEAIPGKQRMVVSCEEMKNIKNIRYGMKNVCDKHQRDLTLLSDIVTRLHYDGLQLLEKLD